MSGCEMRKLYIIPIVHSAADLGRLSQPLQKWKDRKLPAGAAEATSDRVALFWRELRYAIGQWEVPFDQVRLYQDALPVCVGNAGLENRIVTELASKGSENHRLLLWLMEEGARLTGTEDPQLLMQEYEVVRSHIERFERTGDLTDESDNRLAAILEARDAFIAKTIETTLSEKEIGIIFLGMLHQLPKHLANDITIEHPFGVPSEISIVNVRVQNRVTPSENGTL